MESSMSKHETSHGLRRLLVSLKVNQRTPHRATLGLEILFLDRKVRLEPQNCPFLHSATEGRDQNWPKLT